MSGRGRKETGIIQWEILMEKKEEIQRDRTKLEAHVYKKVQMKIGK
jgi:hypothetical protein